MNREVRNLTVAAAVAAVTVTGAVVTVVQDGGDGTRKITGTVDAAPGLGWSLDAAAMYGQSFAEFRDPVTGSEYDWGNTGFVDAGDMLVSIVGISNGGMSLGDPVTVGVDAASGDVRWRSPAEELGGCTSAPVDGEIVCFTSPVADEPALVGFDVTTGDVTRTPTDWIVFAVATVDDRLYVAEGNIEDADVRVHAGTLDDPDASWSRSFDMEGWWEDDLSHALDVAHGQGVVVLGTDLAGFDLDTGEPTWTSSLDGCSRVEPTAGALVVTTRIECDGYRRTGTEVIDGAGRVIAAVDGEVTQSPSFDDPVDATVPVLVGDGGHDRATGERLWTSTDLVSTPREVDEDNANTRFGTATAVVGDIAILRDGDATTALDLRTGKRLWQRDESNFGTVQGHDDRVVVTVDHEAIRAFDLRTGEPKWETPFLAIDDDPNALGSDGMLRVGGDGRYSYVSNRTMIGLRQLPR
ncbi:PQQ-binding-like beta-propeller repeat protein [Prescottella subtropica]|uniref:outer membrane protein assembly factor BamB family protein n=1 Tax=Prescottella subtropica TaxID=2545757 RepID=UPI0010F66621|nr:PQQ-binding-like beta-propeller repeat protein [Prescottella subtropica]